jgi:hypothetical protein
MFPPPSKTANKPYQPECEQYGEGTIYSELQSHTTGSTDKKKLIDEVRIPRPGGKEDGRKNHC